MIEILLADDNPHDINFIEQALQQGGLLHNLHIVNNGQDALDFLSQIPPYDNVPRPDLIILDLHMPVLNGLEVLEKIKTNQNLLSIPTVILTSSDAEQDISDAYQSHVNAYIVKPVDFNKFIDVVGKTKDFWFTIVKRPPSP